VIKCLHDFYSPYVYVVWKEVKGGGLSQSYCAVLSSGSDCPCVLLSSTQKSLKKMRFW